MLLPSSARARLIASSSAIAAAATLLFAAPAPAGPDDPILDPVPEDPIVSGLTLTLDEFASFPKTETTPAPIDPRLVRWARVNYLGEIPDGSGRLYVPDLNGTLYLVEDGTPHPYLDVGGTFAPDFVSGRGLGSGFGFVTFHPDFERNGRFYTVHTEWGAALTEKTPTSRPSPARASTAWSPNGPPPTRRPVRSAAPTARCCASGSPARSTASSRSTSTPRPSAGTAITACCTSRPATAAPG
ncbi:MAG TPA: hypothetical protein VIP77_17990 [Jiangellaceae bacterium]